MNDPLSDIEKYMPVGINVSNGDMIRLGQSNQDGLIRLWMRETNEHFAPDRPPETLALLNESELVRLIQALNAELDVLRRRNAGKASP